MSVPSTATQAGLPVGKLSAYLDWVQMLTGAALILFMLAPAQGWKGIKEFVVNRVAEAGPNPCPPTIIGVGIGGNFELAAINSKKALLRKLDDRHPDPEIAKLEDELLAAINDLGIGPMDIPVFHDDQHGTAIISGAGILNAVEIAGKKIEDLKIVVSGAGAAAIACSKFYVALGVDPANISMLWIISLIVVILIARGLASSRHLRHRRLPGSFDFDHYKAREITQRGVFDKTQWH